MPLRAADLRALGCACLLSTVLASAAHAQAPDRDAVMAEARKLIDAGRPEAAIENLRALATSRDADAAELLGVAYYRAGDAARAIEQLQPILPRLAADSLQRREAVQVLGLSHYLAGHIAEAIPYLEETRRIDAKDIKLSYALGMAYAQTRQPAKARQSFADVFGLAPDSAAAYLLNGTMMNRLELEDLAEAELKAALQQDPRLPEAHYLLGQIAIFRSRLDEGLTLLHAELAINPAHAMALYRIGDIYARQEKWEPAIAALQQSIWINPYFSGPYILMGKAYSRTARLPEAEAMLRRATGYDPNNKSAHYLLGQVLQRQGRTDEAQKEFAIAEKLQGDSVK